MKKQRELAQIEFDEAGMTIAVQRWCPACHKLFQFPERLRFTDTVEKVQEILGHADVEFQRRPCCGEELYFLSLYELLEPLKTGADSE